MQYGVTELEGRSEKVDMLKKHEIVNIAGGREVRLAEVLSSLQEIYSEITLFMNQILKSGIVTPLIIDLFLRIIV